MAASAMNSRDHTANNTYRDNFNQDQEEEHFEEMEEFLEMFESDTIH